MELQKFQTKSGNEIVTVADGSLVGIIAMHPELYDAKDSEDYGAFSEDLLALDNFSYDFGSYTDGNTWLFGCDESFMTPAIAKARQRMYDNWQKDLSRYNALKDVCRVLFGAEFSDVVRYNILLRLTRRRAMDPIWDNERQDDLWDILDEMHRRDLKGLFEAGSHEDAMQWYRDNVDPVMREYIESYGAIRAVHDLGHMKGVLNQNILKFGVDRMWLEMQAEYNRTLARAMIPTQPSHRLNPEWRFLEHASHEIGEATDIHYINALFDRVYNQFMGRQ
jgi:hypothetical protein